MTAQQRKQKQKAREQAQAARDREEREAEEQRRAAREKEEAQVQQEAKEKLQQGAMEASQKPMDERALSREQWLRRIPDDPGGLLRRKFKHYYQRKKYDVPQQQPW
ncbi:hypothetical protein [Thiolapillus sp.]